MSAQVLDELFKQLSISKNADAIQTASAALASSINGDFETGDAPSK